jgi:hypothetical protein
MMCRKGKTFARDHQSAVFAFWRIEAIVILLLLSALAFVTPYVAVFCLAVWLVGLWYSFIPHWFLVQNFLVALCSGSSGALWNGPRWCVGREEPSNICALYVSHPFQRDQQGHRGLQDRSRIQIHRPSEVGNNAGESASHLERPLGGVAFHLLSELVGIRRWAIRASEPFDAAGLHASAAKAGEAPDVLLRV